MNLVPPKRQVFRPFAGIAMLASPNHVVHSFRRTNVAANDVVLGQGCFFPTVSPCFLRFSLLVEKFTVIIGH
jgi:hypothetical protein